MRELIFHPKVIPSKLSVDMVPGLSADNASTRVVWIPRALHGYHARFVDTTCVARTPCALRGYRARSVHIFVEDEIGCKTV